MSNRLDFLRSTQNADGGWGFFPGKQSWLEPTAYALMALHGDSSARPSLERGWKLMRSWQLADGSWKPCAAVAEPHWTTSLCVTLHALNGVHDEAFRRGVNWLLASAGIENGLKFRIAHFLRPSIVELDPSFKAWPWRPGNSSWIEPTTHALVALKKAAQFGDRRAEIGERIRMGESMILERRCSDGGWDYGNRKVLGAELPSYPQTTALALVGLIGNGDNLSAPLTLAQRYLTETRSPLAKAWLSIALRGHSVKISLPSPDSLAANDVLINALQILAGTGAFA